jgi:RNA polymerase sigma-70 factor (ECF subfamily)
MDTTHGQSVTEQDLLASVAEGDMGSFEELYQRYEKRVFQYICTLLRDRTAAEEVVADTMLAVWRGAGSFSHTSRISTWILGIARHKALDAVRRNARRQQDVELDHAADLAQPNTCPIDQIQRDQLAVVTQQAMNRLSQDHREILRLVFYEDLSYEDIAALLDIPVNTVKTRVFYAKQQLKQHLSSLHPEEPVT